MYIKIIHRIISCTKLYILLYHYNYLTRHCKKKSKKICHNLLFLYVLLIVTVNNILKHIKKLKDKLMCTKVFINNFKKNLTVIFKDTLTQEIATIVNLNIL